MFTVFVNGVEKGTRKTFEAAFRLFWEKGRDFARETNDAWKSETYMMYADYLCGTLVADYDSVIALAQRINLLSEAGWPQELPGSEPKRTIIAAFLVAMKYTVSEALGRFPTLNDLYDNGMEIPLNL